MKPLTSAIFTLLLALGTANAALATETLTEAIDSQIKSNQASAATQKAIDSMADQTHRLADEYREALRQTETLDAYNAHLRQLVASQEAEKLSLEKQMGAVEQTRRDVVPLMLKMLTTLERFVELDKPFLREQRTQRLAELKELMNQADVGDAEKFRRLLEAYRTENEYGKTIETYRAELNRGGDTRTVDFLRIGRAALLYQTLDGLESGVWSTQGKSWQPLAGDYNPAVSKGLAVARKDVPPELLTIPVELTEAGR
jgi:hypothetical protein